MSQANLARPWHPAAANHTLRRRRMMRRAKRPLRYQRFSLRKQTANAVNSGNFQTFGQSQFRQNSWQTSGQHGFAGTGRTDHQQIMPAGSRNFHRPFHNLLTLNISHIQLLRISRGLLKNRRHVHFSGLNVQTAAPPINKLAQAGNSPNCTVPQKRSLGGINLRQDKIRNLPLRQDA